MVHHNLDRIEVMGIFYGGVVYCPWPFRVYIVLNSIVLGKELDVLAICALYLKGTKNSLGLSCLKFDDL